MGQKAVTIIKFGDLALQFCKRINQTRKLNHALCIDYERLSCTRWVFNQSECLHTEIDAHIRIGFF